MEGALTGKVEGGLYPRRWRGIYPGRWRGLYPGRWRGLYPGRWRGALPEKVEGGGFTREVGGGGGFTREGGGGFTREGGGGFTREGGGGFTREGGGGFTREGGGGLYPGRWKGSLRGKVVVGGRGRALPGKVEGGFTREGGVGWWTFSSRPIPVTRKLVLQCSHSNECPCGTGPQTPNHILQSCPTFDDLRRQTWLSPVEAHRKFWGPVETLRQTADFALLTGLKI